MTKPTLVLTGNIKKILQSEDPKIIPSVEIGAGVLINDEENNNDDNSSIFFNSARCWC